MSPSESKVVMAVRGGSRGAQAKTSGALRLVEACSDGTLESWPDAPARVPANALEALRLELIGHPGVVHRLSHVFSDVGRAARMASGFRRAVPASLEPSAAGRYDARHYYDPDSRRWRVAVRYVAEETVAHTSAGGG